MALIRLCNNKYFLCVHSEVRSWYWPWRGVAVPLLMGSKQGKGTTFDPLFHLASLQPLFSFNLCTTSSQCLFSVALKIVLSLYHFQKLPLSTFEGCLLSLVCLHTPALAPAHSPPPHAAVLPTTAVINTECWEYKEIRHSSLCPSGMHNLYSQNNENNMGASKTYARVLLPEQIKFCSHSFVQQPLTETPNQVDGLCLCGTSSQVEEIRK